MYKQKQKQIEEMAKVMFEKAFENYETSGSVEIDSEVRRHCYSAFLTYCETLYNAGYRKIPENAVVLDKAEYEELKLGNDFNYGYHEGESNITAYYENIRLPETRKETAAKFADWLKAQYPPRTDERCTLDDCYMLDKIDEIAKEIMEGKV